MNHSSDENLVCAIVGVGPGNGAAFARRFAKAGYKLALLARQPHFIHSLAQEFTHAQAYACDVTDAASVAQTFAAIRQDLGEADTVIFNAGTGVWKSVEEITPEEFEKCWRVNALGSLLVSQQVIPHMKVAKRGQLFFIGATASRRGGAKTAAFAPAKAAQRSLAESIARQLGPAGIHVATVIVDGVVATPSTRKMLPDKPDSYFIQPDDLADVVYDLARQKPSTWSSEIEIRPFGEVW